MYRGRILESNLGTVSSKEIEIELNGQLGGSCNKSTIVIDIENSQLSVINNSIENNSKFNCIYLNARSIVNKIKELELLVLSENDDIVAITETWLNATILDSELNIDGYTLLRKDRIDNKRGGGVALEGEV